MVHGEPLSVVACDPPVQESQSATVSGPDTNGFPANGSGLALLKAFCTNGVALPCSTPGETADVSIDLSLTDVRCAGVSLECTAAGFDYTNRLFAKTVLRLTDKANGTFGNAVATAMDVPLGIPIDCVATSDLAIGSDCNVTTTADSLYPGLVREQSRAVWELGTVEVYDSGPNGTGLESGCPPACGDGDEQVFMHQGLFVP
jgi:hypothetical protein